MAQKKRLQPKDKHGKKSWQKRNASREINQQVYAANAERELHVNMEAQAAAEAEAIASAGSDEGIAS